MGGFESALPFVQPSSCEEFRLSTVDLWTKQRMVFILGVLTTHFHFPQGKAQKWKLFRWVTFRYSGMERAQWR